MLASIPSHALTAWQAFYLVEQEDEREAQERAKVAAAVENAPPPRRVRVVR